MRKKKENFSLSRLLIILMVGLLMIAGVALAIIRKEQGKTDSTQEGIPPVKSSQTVLTKDEEQQILAESEKIVKGWKIENLEFTVEIKKHVGNFVRVLATPLNQTLDPLTIIFERKEGRWQYEDMGTTFPQLEQEAPALFVD